jgi:hypothetical protein
MIARRRHSGEGNANCSPEEELPSNVMTTVRVDIRQTHVELYFDNRMARRRPYYNALSHTTLIQKLHIIR